MSGLADSNRRKRQPAEYSADEIDAGFDALSERLDRIEKAVSTMAWWLTQTPDSFGHHDARGIEEILKGEETE